MTKECANSLICLKQWYTLWLPFTNRVFCFWSYGSGNLQNRSFPRKRERRCQTWHKHKFLNFHSVVVRKGRFYFFGGFYQSCTLYDWLSGYTDISMLTVLNWCEKRGLWSVEGQEVWLEVIWGWASCHLSDREIQWHLICVTDRTATRTLCKGLFVKDFLYFRIQIDFCTSDITQETLRIGYCMNRNHQDISFMCGVKR